MENLPPEGDPGLPEDPYLRAAYENVVGRYSELYDEVYNELYDRACFDAIEKGDAPPDPTDMDAVRNARDKMLLEVRQELWFRERARAIERAEKYAAATRMQKISLTIRRWLRSRGY